MTSVNISVILLKALGKSSNHEFMIHDLSIIYNLNCFMETLKSLFVKLFENDAI